MSVAIMGRSLREVQTGVGRYTANLVHSMAATLGRGELTVFVTQAEHGLGNVDNVRIAQAPFPTPNEYARAFWEQTVVPFQLVCKRIQLYHSPNYILPLAMPCKSVVTVHDLTFRTAPQHHRRRSSIYLSLFTELAARRADHVVCVSQSTKGRFLSYYPDASNRVSVVYQGLSPLFRRPSPQSLEEWQRRNGINHPYILFVGTIEPRKNVVRLVGAFERLVQEHQVPHHLVLCGTVGWLAGPTLQAIETSPLRERLHLMGYVSDADLPFWYAGTALVVYPSLEEGFGLPPLEAMACGAPVVTSNVSAIQEAVGDAAVMVDPHEETDLAEAMAKVLKSPDLEEELRMRGYSRAARFNRETAAQELCTIYERVLNDESQPTRVKEGK